MSKIRSKIFFTLVPSLPAKMMLVWRSNVDLLLSTGLPVVSVGNKIAGISSCDKIVAISPLYECSSAGSISKKNLT